MIVSIETPVAKGAFLQACVDSVLAQSDGRWHLSLRWDGGDEESRRILQRIESDNHPAISVHYGPRLGIAGARRALTAGTRGEYLLPLDDDDCLAPDAVAAFLDAAARAPWAGIVRARREFIDEGGRSVAEPDWFPFAPRRYRYGMTADLFNHAQPTLIARGAYERSGGWHGFDEYGGAGEDCDLVARIEEIADVVLLDRCLYRYRLHGARASHGLGRPAALDMWRRIADATLRRRGLALERVGDEQPFDYARRPRPPLAAPACARIATGREATQAVSAAAGAALCLVDAGAPQLAPQAVSALHAALGGTDADVAAAVAAGANAARADGGEALIGACAAVLLRAEVLRAMPGPDPGLASAGAALADLLWRARARGFACRVVEVAGRGARVPDADRQRLTGRWRSLQAPIDAAAALHAPRRAPAPNA